MDKGTPHPSEGLDRSMFLAEVAAMYYDEGMTQQEIADRVNFTRSGVSRLLKEARERGIVEIIVHHPWRTVPALEGRLREAFDLKEVRVLTRGNKSYEEMLKGLGFLAAQYFLRILEEEDAVGISWGTGLYQMLEALRPVAYADVEVVQLVGGTGTEKSSSISSSIGPLLAPLLANRLGCSCRYLHAPLVTETRAARDALLQEQSIRVTLERGETCDVALVGIGSTDPEVYNPYRLGYVTEDELEEVRAAGAIGTMCGHLYDVHGRALDIEFNRRVIGISPQALSRIETVVGVAGGAVKTEAILGALRGGFVNVLITDEKAAEAVLELNGGR
jgi:DNA-binding transcriptional regulator LsrR (DeoR family)